MKRETILWSTLAAVLLFVGLAVGRTLAPGASDHVEDIASTFRTWFWERRTIDLLVQVGLIFAGALGVAAILPHPRETSETDAGLDGASPWER